MKQSISTTTKGGSRRLEKSHKLWMMMMITASLMWAGAAEKPEQSKMIFKNHQNDKKNSLSSQSKFNQNPIKNTEDTLLDGFGWSVGQAKK